MERKWLAALTLLLILPVLLFTVSCSKKQVKTNTELTGGADGSLVQRGSQGSQSGAGTAEGSGQEGREGTAGSTSGGYAGGDASGMGSSDRDSFVNEDVYFSFDSSALSSTAQEVLQRKAQFMRGNSGVSVDIEGHCDERGTSEYNMALGDRRARSAKDFLVNLGIPSSMMNTISYGEERPVDGDHGEDAWAKNRRAHFLIGR